MLSTDLPAALLSRIEDAGINASAPPQQRWVDGWLLRFSPGKAKRARCINAVADGRLPLAERLALCEAVFREAGLPMFVRVTPFTRPAELDAALAQSGYHVIDDTRVMVAPDWPAPAEVMPRGFALERLTPAEFAEQVGALRGSPATQRRAHAERLALSPVPYEGWVLRRRDDGHIAACGQMATEADLVGLYDVFTHPGSRGQGLARVLCSQLLARARSRGARVAYLQVESDNHPARAVYHRLGFADAYAYHYRSPEPGAH
ncbi:GNAT family N-acetyltransferase [Aquabacterium sp.]|uniref:GNAT family N-acetyltransferase n=1 Tax=Aquabacterium sp. TaxID=1872578 RepID=UPI002C62D2C4|nr:GNAT family N-acetyltransferase [Aquabacterium sp.]HSW08852.1 GNAT family N-acetyltransferase [Aquabacterium sp.]